MAQEFRDTQPTGENTQVDYRDPTDVDEVESEIQHGVIDPVSQKLALWIRTKMYRRHVREALARMMEYSNVLFNKIKMIAEKTEKRQGQVEERQTDLESQFKKVIENATEDSEIIHARISDSFGSFKVLDDRLENIESLLNEYVPKGNHITIKRKINSVPQVVVTTWEYGLGILPLGTEETGFFGGTLPEVVNSKLVSWLDGEIIIRIPKNYSGFEFVQRSKDGEYLFVNGTRSLKVTIDGGQPVGSEFDQEQGKIEETASAEQITKIDARVSALEERLEGENDHGRNENSL